MRLPKRFLCATNQPTNARTIESICFVALRAISLYILLQPLFIQSLTFLFCFYLHCCCALPRPFVCSMPLSYCSIFALLLLLCILLFIFLFYVFSNKQVICCWLCFNYCCSNNSLSQPSVERTADSRNCCTVSQAS